MNLKWSNGPWWFSCKKFTVRIVVRDNLSVESAPVTRRFVGQPVVNLKTWFESFGGFECQKLEAGGR